MQRFVQWLESSARSSETAPAPRPLFDTSGALPWGPTYSDDEFPFGSSVSAWHRLVATGATVGGTSISSDDCDMFVGSVSAAVECLLDAGMYDRALAVASRASLVLGSLAPTAVARGDAAEHDNTCQQEEDIARCGGGGFARSQADVLTASCLRTLGRLRDALETAIRDRKESER
jgi:hypothetical protein